MDKILDVLGAIGIWPAIGAGLIVVFVHFFRPQERRLRRLERLAGLRSTLGDRGVPLDATIDELVDEVAGDQEDADVRPLQWVYVVGGLVATGCGFWMIWTSVFGTPEEFAVATGFNYRPGAIGFSICMTLFVASMSIAGVRWDARQHANLGAELRKARRDKTARSKGATLPPSSTRPATGPLRDDEQSSGSIAGK